VYLNVWETAEEAWYVKVFNLHDGLGFIIFVWHRVYKFNTYACNNRNWSYYLMKFCEIKIVKMLDSVPRKVVHRNTMSRLPSETKNWKKSDTL